MQKNKLLICVSQQDINRGIRCSGNTCPIALALKRALTWTDIAGPELHVDGLLMFIDEVAYHVPRSVSSFVREFDNQNTVRPFNFWLRRENELRT